MMKFYPVRGVDPVVCILRAAVVDVGVCDRRALVGQLLSESEVGCRIITGIVQAEVVLRLCQIHPRDTPTSDYCSLKPFLRMGSPATMEQTPEPDAAAAAAQAPIHFRAGKKRKAYRQRPDADASSSIPDEPDAPRQTADQDAISSAAVPDRDDHDVDESAVAAAVRRAARNARRARVRGVGFTSGARADDDDDAAARAEQALVLRDQDAEDGGAVVSGITGRFTHQTGLVSDLSDRHMYVSISSRLRLCCWARSDPPPLNPNPPGAPSNATNQSRNEYIESRLSSRPAPTGTSLTRERSGAGAAHDTAQGPPRPDQAATRGRLMEVDLDAQASSRAPPQGRDLSGRAGGAKRMRMGKDGKPWRPRNRRGSDDVKRDQLVEEFLRENRRELYPYHRRDIPLLSQRSQTNHASPFQSTCTTSPTHQPPAPRTPGRTAQRTSASPSSSSSSTWTTSRSGGRRRSRPRGLQSSRAQKRC